MRHLDVMQSPLMCIFSAKFRFGNGDGGVSRFHFHLFFGDHPPPTLLPGPRFGPRTHGGTARIAPTGGNYPPRCCCSLCRSGLGSGCSLFLLFFFFLLLFASTLRTVDCRLHSHSQTKQNKRRGLCLPPAPREAPPRMKRARESESSTVVEAAWAWARARAHFQFSGTVGPRGTRGSPDPDPERGGHGHSARQQPSARRGGANRM